MGVQWGLKWPTNQEVFNESQIASVLNELGIEVQGETEKVFLALCPFHNNHYSPALAVSKSTGLYYCHNGACATRGNLRQLIQRKGNYDEFAANRMIHRHASEIDYAEEMRKRAEPFTFKEYTDHDLSALRSAFPNSPAHKYMRGRGFADHTLQHFDVGYSILDPREMALVPVHDPDGMEIGFVGRSILDKRFQNSDDLPKSKTLFNFHNAKRVGSSCIVVEAAFDAMMVHQAGYPNVVATLGSSLSNHQRELLGRTFDTVIIFTDWDTAGRKLGQNIQDKLSHKSIRWAGMSDTGLYPTNDEGKMFKDATDMRETHIRSCLRGALSPARYHMLVDVDLDSAT